MPKYSKPTSSSDSGENPVAPSNQLCKMKEFLPGINNITLVSQSAYKIEIRFFKGSSYEYRYYLENIKNKFFQVIQFIFSEFEMIQFLCRCSKYKEQQIVLKF